MAEVFDSGALAGLSPSNPLIVNHNLGYIPAVATVYRVNGGQRDGWEPADSENPTEGPAPVYISNLTANSATVEMLDGYNYSGSIQLVFNN